MFGILLALRPLDLEGLLQFEKDNYFLEMDRLRMVGKCRVLISSNFVKFYTNRISNWSNFKLFEFKSCRISIFLNFEHDEFSKFLNFELAKFV